MVGKFTYDASNCGINNNINIFNNKNKKGTIMIQEMIMKYLFNEDNKKKIINELNKNVNIPIINEDTEEKIISSIYDVFEDVMGKVLKK